MGLVEFVYRRHVVNIQMQRTIIEATSAGRSDNLVMLWSTGLWGDSSITMGFWDCGASGLWGYGTMGLGHYGTTGSRWDYGTTM